MHQAKSRDHHTGWIYRQTLMGIKLDCRLNPQHISRRIYPSIWEKHVPRKKKGIKSFLRDFGGKVFVVMPVNGMVPPNVEKAIIAESNLLKQLPPK